MKSWLVSGVMILALVLIVLTCNRNQVPDDSIVIKRSTMDSINQIANSIPDTIYRVDTVPGKTIVRWIEKPIPPKGKDSVIRDSLVNEDIAIHVIDSASIRKIGYTLFAPKIITRTFEITKKVPVYVIQPTVQKKWYAMGGIGNGVSVELGRTIKRYDYGLQIIRFDNKNCVLVKTGIRF